MSLGRFSDAVKLFNFAVLKLRDFMHEVVFGTFLFPPT